MTQMLLTNAQSSFTRKASRLTGARRVTGLISSILLLTLIVPLASADVYYVRIDGSDANTGRVNSSAGSWRTVQKALESVSAGDTVYIGAGSFDGGTSANSGNETNHIRFIGAGNTSSYITSRLTINHSYLDFEQLNILELWFQSDAAGNRSVSNYFTGAGIKLKLQGSYGLASRNTFTYWDTENINNPAVLLGGFRNLVSSNLFNYNNGHDGVRPFGISNVVSDNVFTNFVTGGAANPPHSDHADIMQVFTTSTDSPCWYNVFERNLVINCDSQIGNLESFATAGSGGVLSTNLHDLTIRNNIIVNSRPQLNCYIPRVFVYNNTFYNGTGWTTGIRILNDDNKGRSNGSQIYNNLFVRMDGNESGGGVFQIAGGLTNVAFGNNFVTDLDDSSKSSFDPGPGSINGGYAPAQIFVDPANLDFRLRQGSPAIGVGKNMSGLFNSDFSAKLRPSTGLWSVGAFEFANYNTPVNGVGQWIEVETGLIDSPFATANGSVSQSVLTSVTAGGRLAIQFNVNVSGDYAVLFYLAAQSDASNSIFFNIDGEPADPFMIWDIPVTSGFESRVGAWRGAGSFDSAEFAPKYFSLSAGTHQLIVRGREANVFIDKVMLSKRPAQTDGVLIER